MRRSLWIIGRHGTVLCLREQNKNSLIPFLQSNFKKQNVSAACKMHAAVFHTLMLIDMWCSVDILMIINISIGKYIDRHQYIKRWIH